MTHPRPLQAVLCLSVLLLSLTSPCLGNNNNQPLDLTPTQAQLLLDLHNSLRSTVTPPSSNMQGLYYDNALASAASALAATCPPPTATSTPQQSTNIAYIPPFAADGTQGATAQLPITNALAAWTATAPYYSYAQNTCGSVGGCLAWLNLVHAPTYAIGCGLSAQQCGSVPVTYANSSEAVIGSGFAIVCMYKGGGAGAGGQPYAAGLSCGGCPANFAACSRPSTCVASSGTCPALCAVAGGLTTLAQSGGNLPDTLVLGRNSGLAGTIIGVVLGFLLLVVLSVYGYSVYWWRENGMYGNVKPVYKYAKATSKDDDDPNTTRAIADAPLAQPASSVPLSRLGETATASPEPASPIPTAQPIKPPAIPAALAPAPTPTPTATVPAAANATPAPAAAAVTTASRPAATPTSPSVKPKPSSGLAAKQPPPITTRQAASRPPAVPSKPSSPSAARLAAGGRAGSGRATPTSPRSGGALPEGWSVHKDASGNQYYFNTTTGQTQWSKPSQ